MKYHRDDWIQDLYFQEMVMQKPKEIRDDQYARSKQQTKGSADRDKRFSKQVQT